MLGSLAFSAGPGASAFVPLIVTDVVGIQADGTLVGNSSGQAGRVVVIGAQPLLEAWLSTNGQRMLTLYGNPGTSYQTAFNTNLLSTNWQSGWRVPLTNLYQEFTVDSTPPQLFYRSWEFFGNRPISNLHPALRGNLTLLPAKLSGANDIIPAPTSNFMLPNSFPWNCIGSPTNNAAPIGPKDQ